MNRNMRGFAASLMISLLALPYSAFAGWHTDELGWHISRIGGSGGTSIVQVDTFLTVVNGASVLDTSATFTLDRADTPLRGLVAPGLAGGEVNGIPTALYAYQSDTTTVAFLSVQADTPATATITNGTITVMVDGKIGGYGITNVNSAGWSRVDSVVTTVGAVADQSVGIPIRTSGKYGSPFAFSSLRIRTIGGTAIIGSARCFLRWWENDSSNPHRP